MRHRPRDVPDTDVVQGEERQQTGAPDVGEDGVLRLKDRTAESVGVDLAPQVGVRSTPDEGERVEPLLAELLDRLEQPRGVQRHPLEDGTDHVGPGG